MVRLPVTGTTPFFFCFFLIFLAGISFPSSSNVTPYLVMRLLSFFSARMRYFLRSIGRRHSMQQRKIIQTSSPMAQKTHHGNCSA